MCRLQNIAIRVWQTDGQTDRRTDRQTDRQTDGQTTDKVIPMCRYASQATKYKSKCAITDICKLTFHCELSFFLLLSERVLGDDAVLSLVVHLTAADLQFVLVTGVPLHVLNALCQLNTVVMPVLENIEINITYSRMCLTRCVDWTPS